MSFPKTNFYFAFPSANEVKLFQSTRIGRLGAKFFIFAWSVNAQLLAGSNSLLAPRDWKLFGDYPTKQQKSWNNIKDEVPLSLRAALTGVEVRKKLVTSSVLPLDCASPTFVFPRQSNLSNHCGSLARLLRTYHR